MSSSTARPHTGRRRNEAARAAILDAAADLLLAGADASIDAIAAAAGVGRQTIYRWWPSKGAVLLDAMIERADLAVAIPDTGALRSDLHAFLAATFATAGSGNTAAVLRAIMAEAQRDQHAAHLLGGFTRDRRAALAAVFAHAAARGELSARTDVGLLIDQAFGVLWYRILIGHADLDDATASTLAEHLARLATRSERPAARGTATPAE